MTGFMIDEHGVDKWQPRCLEKIEGFDALKFIISF